MNLDIHSLRAETPGCSRVTHLNNAGASLLAEPILNAVTGYLKQEALYGGYETAAERKQELEATYDLIGELIHADRDEIALMENATAAWNMAFYSIPFSAGDRILTSVSEYASNYINYLNLKNRTDVSVEVIPSDSSGQTDPEALAGMMDDKVRLISISHIPTNNGLVNPAEAIGKIAKEHGVLYLLDACQSVGQYSIDVTKIGCDMLSATGRKYLRAPRGTGFLYVNRKVLDLLHPPFLDLHSAEWTGKDQFEVRRDARKFENWEANYAGIIGLNRAVSYILDIGIDSIWDRVQVLGAYFRSELENIPGVTVRDLGKVKCGIVTFTVDDKSADQIKQYLKSKDINVSVSTRSSTLLDMQNRNLEQAVRASVHYYNTKDEINSCVNALRSLG
ncbi:MAG: aminotransferase class V-fold PLP-dependent enzyme [Balneolaceae bacterium]|nr:aminotransferase class V-fold PLP-dependent enzyme [Balneolaceae bacterium]